MNERGHLCALTLDRLLLASLPEEELKPARAHLDQCATCRTTLSEMEADRLHFERSVLPRTLPLIRERAAPVPLLERIFAQWRLALPAAGALAAAALLLLVRSPNQNDLGIKGGPVLQVFARHGDAVFQLKPGARLGPGDRLRFVVDPAGSRYLLIASLDGAGKVSLYFPANGEQSAEVSPGRDELPGSIELDDTRGTERLYAIFSDAPLAFDQVAEALLRSAPDAPQLPGAKAISLSYDKEAP